MAITSAAAAKTLTAITAAEPGTVPLLSSLPDGSVVQLPTPLDATIDQIKEQIAASTGTTQPVELSFANSVLRGDSLLADTNIVEVYGHASGLLRAIGEGTLDPGEQAKALDTTVAVVQSLSDGINDMEALCERAFDIGSGLGAWKQAADKPSFPTKINDILDETAACPNATLTHADSLPGPSSGSYHDTDASRVSDADSIGSGEFKMLESYMAMPTRNRVTNTDDGLSYVPNPDAIRVAHPVIADSGIALAGGDGAPTPSNLARKLSQKLPNLFKPSAVEDLARRVGDASVPTGERMDDADYRSNDMHSSSGRNRNNIASAQPSISAIRAARRQLKSKQQGSRLETPQSALATSTSSDAGDYIASQLNSKLVQLTLDNPAVEYASRSGSATFAKSGQSTWIKDFMKTLEVEALRNSGILKNAVNGQDVESYLNGLDREAQDEEAEELKRIHGDLYCPGESGDSELEDEADNNPVAVDGATDLNCTTAPPVGVEDFCEPRSTIIKSMHPAQLGLSSPPHSMNIESSPFQDSLSGLFNTSKDSPNVHAPVFPVGCGVASTLESIETAVGLNSETGIEATPLVGCRPLQSPAEVVQQAIAVPRVATKIAPAPIVRHDQNMPDHNNLSIFPRNEMLDNFPSSRAFAIPPKRRGRKRKNPELTEEERGLLRRLQNRESAKLSRVRRKVIAAEYEDQISELIDSNTSLREQVASLSSRLSYLQSILSVSVLPAQVASAPVDPQLGISLNETQPALRHKPSPSYSQNP